MTVQLAKRPARPLPPSDLAAPDALHCAWERPSVVAREVEKLSRRWATELGRSSFDIDWERVFALERSGSMMVWTARTPNGLMAGYLVCTSNKGLFTGERFTRVEAGYLAPEWRDGLKGYRFIKAFVSVCKGPIEWETNDAFEPDAHGRSRLARLLERLGFVQTGTTMRR